MSFKATPDVNPRVLTNTHQGCQKQSPCEREPGDSHRRPLTLTGKGGRFCDSCHVSSYTLLRLKQIPGGQIKTDRGKRFAMLVTKSQHKAAEMKTESQEETSGGSGTVCVRACVCVYKNAMKPPKGYSVSLRIRTGKLDHRHHFPPTRLMGIKS